ncbi:hypothetical protein MHU86_16770 [Fragilaria crotonensis]|nr:hypothetical protein MHU86_16770 [Fragilaria crotonensis]
MTRISVRIILVVLLLSLTTPANSLFAPYILCPLGNDTVNLERNEKEGNWFVSLDPGVVFNNNDNTNTTATTNSTPPTIIQGKPCWCVTLGDQYPAFCPIQFDTCRIDEGFQVTCLNLERRETFGLSWIVPFVGPFVILMYAGLILSCCFLRRGFASRDYLVINVLSCCGRHRERYEQRLERSLHRNEQLFRGWSRHLLDVGITRERARLQARGEPDPWIVPTRLELKTKIYRSTAELPDDHHLETPTAGPDVDLEISCPEIPSKEAQDIASDVGNEEPDEENCPISCQEDTRSFVDSDDDGVLCAICYSGIDEGDRVGNIPCHHLFHVDCLKPWLKKKNECPLCSTRSIAIPKA